MKKPEGCTRKDSCQYLHREPRKNSHSENRSGLIACESCEYKASENEDINYHIQTEHGYVPSNIISCDICDFTSSTQESLDTHTTTNHHNAAKNPTQIIFTCYGCNINFGEANLLQKHQENLHNNEKQEFTLNCLNCGYIASNETQLDGHLEMCYSMDPEFSCDVCDFSAKNKGGLTRHKNAQHQMNKIATMKVTKAPCQL